MIQISTPYKLLRAEPLIASEFVKNQPVSDHEYDIVNLLEVQQNWQFGYFGEAIGRSGLDVIDLDGDGIDEVITTASYAYEWGYNDYWYILKYNSQRDDYEISWASPAIYWWGEQFSALLAQDINEDNQPEIIVGRGWGLIEIYNPQTMQVDTTINTGVLSLDNIVYGDADNDGENELLVAGEDQISVFSTPNLNPKGDIPYSGSDVAIGDVDGDGQNEIVISTGIVIELHSEGYTIEWEYEDDQFGSNLQLIDIDYDNMDEIIGVGSWYNVKAFDADQQTLKWSFSTDTQHNCAMTYDANADGVKDLVIGTYQSGNVLCYDLTTQTELWRYLVWSGGIGHLGLGDVDGDSSLEMVAGSGFSNDGKDRIEIFNPASQEREWRSPMYDTPLSAWDVGDVDADGDPELVAISPGTDHYRDDPVLLVFDANTHELEWQSDYNYFGPSTINYDPILDLEVFDINQDGQDDILFPGMDRHIAQIFVINGLTHQQETSFTLPDQQYFSSVTATDMYHNGNVKVIAASERISTPGDWGNYVYIFNAETRQIEWQSQAINESTGTIWGLTTSDLNQDGIDDIFFLNDWWPKMYVHLIDGQSKEMWVAPYDTCGGFDIGDVDLDGSNELVYSHGPYISILDGTTLQEEQSYQIFQESNVLGLRLVNIQGDARPEVILGGSGTITIFSLELDSIIYQGENLTYSPGYRNQLLLADLDGNGNNEIIASTANFLFEMTMPVSTGIAEETSAQTVEEFILENNYPNPFNPTTTIQYELPVQAKVNLTIYDITGREVTILKDEHQSAGIYTIQWKATNNSGNSVSTGVYFCRLQAGGFSKTIKMVYLK